MTLPSDPLATLIAYLLTNEDVSALVGGRIYGGPRPTGSGVAAPVPAISIAPIGGAPRIDLPLAEVEMDLRCWGGLGPDGPYRAVAIWRALHAALNVHGRAIETAHLLWAVEESGPALLQDPDTHETFVRFRVRVATADSPLSAA